MPQNNTTRAQSDEQSFRLVSSDESQNKEDIETEHDVKPNIKHRSQNGVTRCCSSLRSVTFKRDTNHQYATVLSIYVLCQMVTTFNVHDDVSFNYRIGRQYHSFKH